MSIHMCMFIYNAIYFAWWNAFHSLWQVTTYSIRGQSVFSVCKHCI